MSLAVVGFHLKDTHQLQSLALGQYAEVGGRHCLLSLGALHLQLCLALGANASVRFLVHGPCVSAVHAGGLSVLQLKGVVVKTLTERPFCLLALDRS